MITSLSRHTPGQEGWGGGGGVRKQGERASESKERRAERNCDKVLDRESQKKRGRERGVERRL